MNVSELARKLNITTDQLLTVLPRMGVDIGAHAIKIDNRTADRVLNNWKSFIRQLDREHREEKKREEEQKILKEQRKAISVPDMLTVRAFAELLGLPVSQLMKVLMNNGILATLNDHIDHDTASIVAQDLGYEVKETNETHAVESLLQEQPAPTQSPSDNTDFQPRPPVIVVMGHIDHGKTKLLDAIRSTNVVEGEAGGITQHIGAYQITKNNRKVTFIDTPGHEAFMAMRARGAKIADVAILVVAADDGVKPQTVEAYRIIQGAKIPVVVAINKIDREGTNIDRVKQELSQQLNIIPEDWGGTVICVPISAKNNTNIDQLLDMILLVADVDKEKIMADPHGTPTGSIIESHIDKGEGAVATILVQSGTLETGQWLVISGAAYGKIRQMKDDRGHIVTSAPPSMPVKIIGLKQPPQVGDVFTATDDIERSVRRTKLKEATTNQLPALPSVQQEKDESNDMPKLSVSIKADVLGSLEAITQMIETLPTEEVKVDIVHKGLGNITEVDVERSKNTNAIIYGFHVQVPPHVQEQAREKNVIIRQFTVIYHLIDDIKKEVETLLAPTIVRHDLGSIDIVKVFSRQHNKTIAGGRVNDGRIVVGSIIRIQRGSEEAGRGTVKGLQTGKQDAPEVRSGQECGILIESKIELKPGDHVIAFSEEKVKRSLE